MNKRLFFLISLVLVLCLASSASAAMIGWWTFDDSDATDSGPGSHHGTVVADGPNTVTFVFDVERDSNVAYFAGDPCVMINLGGGRTSIEDPCTWADIYGDTITMALWLKTDGLFDTSYQCAFAKEDNYKFSRHGSTRRTMRVYLDDDAGGTFGGEDMVADDGQWHHLAAVYNGTTLILYWDGEIDNWENQDGDIGVNAGTTWDVTIGNNQEEYDRAWKGWIDDVRLYDSAYPMFIVRTWAGAYDTYDPVPVDGAEYQEKTLAQVSWTGMGGTTNYRLYLGTSFTDVNTGAAGVDKGEIPGLTMNYSGAPMGDLAYATTYYWRVDSNRSGTVYPGDVWEFTTKPAWTEDPRPPDGTTHYGLSESVGWRGGAGSIRHEVFFSTNEAWVTDACDAVHVATIDAPDPCVYSPTLVVDTTYYWRVDANTGTLYSVGNVWSFSTEATTPEPGLVGYWPLKETDGSGNLTWDMSGKGHNGTLVQGASGTSIGIVYDADRDCNVLDVNNPVEVLNSVVDCGGTSASSPLNVIEAMTLMGWLTMESNLDGENYWITKGSAYRLRANGDTTNSMESYHGGFSDTRQNTVGNISLYDGWHHVALTYDSNASERMIYIDGKRLPGSWGLEEVNDLMMVDDDPFVIGGRLDSEEDTLGWDGRVSEVKMYDRALTCVEVVSGAAQCATAVGDLDANSVINLTDLNILVGLLTTAKINTGQWLINPGDAGWKNCADMEVNGVIDLADLNRMVGNLTWEEITTGTPGTWSYPAGKYCP